MGVRGAERAAVTTILFTDLVGSTELMGRVGDERAQGLFAAHHKLLADAVSAHGGSELQWLGDGLMVAFASTGGAARARGRPPRCRRERVDQEPRFSSAPRLQAGPSVVFVFFV